MSELTAIVPALAAGRGEFELVDFRARKLELLLVLSRASDGARVDVAIGPAGTPGAIWRGQRCSVRYSTEAGSASEAERAELGAIVSGVGGAADAWLGEHPDASPADLPQAFAGPSQELPFSPEGVLALLGLRLGSELPGGWRLSAIYPSSLMSESPSAQLSLVLELVHPGDGSLRLELGPRNDAARAFARSAHLDLSYLTLGSSPPPSSERAVRVIGLLLRVRDGAATRIGFVAASAPAAALALPGAGPRAALASGGEWLNLAVNSGCGQACVFCSVLEVSPAWSDDANYQRLLFDLRSNAESGVRRLRLNGYDPLAFPRIVELARAAKELGYEEALVYSPCTRLADEAFLDALLAALPENTTFHVPVYAASASVHDRVVGREGSFALVERALELIAARIGKERIVVTSVAVRENIEHLIGLRKWALTRASRFRVQTPYPSSESPRDRFHGSAASFTAIAAATLADDGGSVIVDGVPPCVYFRASLARGIDPRSWLTGNEPRRPLPGREYAGGSFSHRALMVQHSAFVAAAMECQHQEACALRAICPREILRSYADLYGSDEIAAVPLADVLRSEAR